MTNTIINIHHYYYYYCYYYHYYANTTTITITAASATTATTTTTITSISKPYRLFNLLILKQHFQKELYPWLSPPPQDRRRHQHARIQTHLLQPHGQGRANPLALRLWGHPLHRREDRERGMAREEEEWVLWNFVKEKKYSVLKRRDVGYWIFIFA